MDIESIYDEDDEDYYSDGSSYTEEYLSEIDYNDYYNDDYNKASSSKTETKSSTITYIKKAEKAMKTLKAIVKETDWKKELVHKSGVIVYSKNNDGVPIYMGTYEINGFHPQTIFAVIGMRKLWDDLYEEGNLVENLDDSTSLTYMVLQGLSGSKPRDLSLVEKISCEPNGTIYFAATSVQTEKVPLIVNRIRAHIGLNGWILEPKSTHPPKTKVTYVLQSQVKGWIPDFLAKKYLSRRPLILHTIDLYLQKNGPPPVVASSVPFLPHSQTSSLSTNGLPTPPPSTSSSVLYSKTPESTTLYSSSATTTATNTTANVSPSTPKLDNSNNNDNNNNNNVKMMNSLNESTTFKMTTKLVDFDDNTGGNYAMTTITSSVYSSPNELSAKYNKNKNDFVPFREFDNNAKFVKDSRNQNQPESKPLPPSKRLAYANTIDNTSDLSGSPSEQKDLSTSDLSFKRKEKDVVDVQKKNTDDKSKIVVAGYREEPKDRQKDKIASSFASHKKYEKESQPSLTTKSSSEFRKKPLAPEVSLLAAANNNNNNNKSITTAASKSTNDPSSSYPKISKDKKTHSHTNALKEALDKFKLESSSLEGWKFYSENKGLKIYMKDVVGKSVPIMRGEMIINGGFTTEDVYATIYSLDMKKLWDGRHEDGEIIKFLNNRDCLVRVATKGTFPVSGRDMSLAGTTDLEEGTGTLRYVTTSVVDPLIPQSKKYVRADLKFAGWEFIPIFSDSSDEKIESVLCKYIVDIDIKLDAVPSSILKQISLETPMTILKINDLLHKIGHPPYKLLKSTTTTTSTSTTSTLVSPDQLNIKTFDYVATIKSFPGAVAEIKFSKLMYPNGFDISFEPYNDNDGIKIELLADYSEIIRVTVTSSTLSSDKLKVKIKKNVNTKGYSLTYNNGTKNIPVAAKEEIIKKHKEKTVKEIPNNNNSLVSKIDKDSGNHVYSGKVITRNNENNHNSDFIDKYFDDLDNNKTLVPKNINIANILNNNDDNNNGQQHRISVSRISISEQTFIKQISENGSSFRTVSTDFEKRIFRVDSFRRKRTSNLKYSTIFKDEERTRSSTAIADSEKKLLLNSDANTNANSNANDNAGMVIEFDPRTIIMMTLSMVVSYYAGKFGSL